jgi:hypothetical protein
MKLYTLFSRYIFTGNSPWRHIWVMIVCASIMIASFFIFTAASDFNRSTVVTTIHSTTESLDEVYFPAVTICNINQVRFISFVRRFNRFLYRCDNHFSWTWILITRNKKPRKSSGCCTASSTQGVTEMLAKCNPTPIQNIILISIF